jgi:NADPH:quinone reductase-like Zn-dependent oxidoreductase
VFDPVGGETFTKSLAVLKPGGIIVTMVEPADEAQATEAGVRIISQFTRATTERLEKVGDLIDAGAIRVPVDTVYPLDQVVAAMDHLESGHPQGKIVIQINS